MKKTSAYFCPFTLIPAFSIELRRCRCHLLMSGKHLRSDLLYPVSGLPLVFISRLLDLFQQLDGFKEKLKICTPLQARDSKLPPYYCSVLTPLAAAMLSHCLSQATYITPWFLFTINSLLSFEWFFLVLQKFSVCSNICVTPVSSHSDLQEDFCPIIW